MTRLDVEAIRAQVRALDFFVRGSSAEIAIEDMALTPDEDVLFDMLREEAVPPPLATAIVLKLLDHPDADPALAITPAMIVADR